MGRPFVVNVRDVLRQPGVQRRLDLVGAFPGIALDTASTRIPDDADVQADLTLEAQGGTLIVQGTAAAPWVGECRRCLGTTRGAIQVDLHEVFEEDPVEGETFPLTGEQVDLAPLLREALTLGLPLAPLCADDCAGPDPEQHPVGTVLDGADGDEGPPRDPRWAALDQLRADR